MLNNAKGFNRIYIATGFTDLRRGIEGLSGSIEKEFHLDPFDRNTLFLFCGKRNDRIKGLLWEGDGFLLFMVTGTNVLCAAFSQVNRWGTDGLFMTNLIFNFQ